MLTLLILALRSINWHIKSVQSSMDSVSKRSKLRDPPGKWFTAALRWSKSLTLVMSVTGEVSSASGVSAPSTLSKNPGDEGDSALACGDDADQLKFRIKKIYINGRSHRRRYAKQAQCGLGDISRGCLGSMITRSAGSVERTSDCKTHRRRVFAENQGTTGIDLDDLCTRDWNLGHCGGQLLYYSTTHPAYTYPDPTPTSSAACSRVTAHLNIRTSSHTHSPPIAPTTNLAASSFSARTPNSSVTPSPAAYVIRHRASTFPPPPTTNPLNCNVCTDLLVGFSVPPRGSIPRISMSESHAARWQCLHTFMTKPLPLAGKYHKASPNPIPGTNFHIFQIVFILISVFFRLPTGRVHFLADKLERARERAE
ncbi:hypothetical protein AG1IA_06061 [Rhizoctonia solani AG-1 IA]|uniref:Uncharacterized protein n=1 Tax=Thanatephorus cucumeris (strain AG1-IA) TaxID=983506 RepID=L8WP35_THACA|nr:hypothetical protein AG1IA_06061 [Rhizoctonia solani AG-1 IA]